MCCVIYKCYLNRIAVLFWLPVIAEWIVMAWTYYVYVFVMCLTISKFQTEAVILLFFYHIVVFLGLWCHLAAIFTTPIQPPQEFKYDEGGWYKLNNEYPWIQKREETERLKITLGIRTTQASTGRGLIVYCIQCKNIKPDRCHHCSRCGICVLRMDHHCPWINNCVGFHNYKYFLLFTTYTFLGCLYITATSMKFVVSFVLDFYNGVEVDDRVNRIQVMTMTLVVMLVGLALVPLLQLHQKLLLGNTTTLENTRPVELVGMAPDLRIFDLGWKENFLHTFGHRKLLWFIPVFTSLGDGAHFPLREDHFFHENPGQFGSSRITFL